jgi:phage baseplate assembly protein gpV
MWASKDNGENINWHDAKRYCENYRGGGYTDWRMPTLDELSELYNPKKKSINGYFITGLISLSSSCPWSSVTSGVSQGNLKLKYSPCFDFDDGKKPFTEQFLSGGGRALPVRDDN